MKNSYNSITKHQIKNWGQALNRHFSEEEKQMTKRLMKDVQHHQLLGKLKSKPQ